MGDITEVYGSVSNAFGTRSGKSTLAATAGEAQGIANDVITTVNTTLDNLRDLGNNSMGDAFDAISALGAFHPMAIAVSYTPPGFESPGYTTPEALELSAPDAIEPPDTGEVTLAITPVTPPDVTAVPPISTPVTFNEAPKLQPLNAPTEPRLGAASTPDTFTPGELGELNLTLPIAPTLRSLNLPVFTPPLLPDYTPPTLQTEPVAPSIAVAYDPGAYTPTFDVGQPPDLGGALIGPDVTARDLRAGVLAYSGRGAPLSEDVAAAQLSYFNESDALLNAAERRQLNADQRTWDLDSVREVLKAAVEADSLLINTALALAKSAFEAGMLEADARLQLVGSLTALYNARLAAYAADVELYRLGLEQEVAKLDYWKTEVQAEVAKTKANAQLAATYSAEVQVEATKADIYAAQVQAVLAEAQNYRATVDAITVAAEAARVQIQVYKAETEAYVAKLGASKVEFEAYATEAKGLAAQNAAQQVQTQLSVAEIERVGAQASVAAATTEINAENLKLAANKIASSYQASHTRNLVEATNAQVQGDIGRFTAMRYAAGMQLKEIPNEAAGAFAQTAARYYGAASDAAYRASEQALRAVTSATQAAAVAQEAAGKTAAAVAQGAYSALHVSAGLHGTGRVDGSETNYGRFSQHYSDMLTYTEAKEQILSA